MELRSSEHPGARSHGPGSARARCLVQPGLLRWELLALHEFCDFMMGQDRYGGPPGSKHVLDVGEAHAAPGAASGLFAQFRQIVPNIAGHQGDLGEGHIAADATIHAHGRDCPVVTLPVTARRSGVASLHGRSLSRRRPEKPLRMPKRSDKLRGEATKLPPPKAIANPRRRGHSAGHSCAQPSRRPALAVSTTGSLPSGS